MRPHRTTLMPVGTVVEEADGSRWRKTPPSAHNPWPWTSQEPANDQAFTGAGVQVSGERITHLIGWGAQVIEQPEET